MMHLRPVHCSCDGSQAEVQGGGTGSYVAVKIHDVSNNPPNLSVYSVKNEYQYLAFLINHRGNTPLYTHTHLPTHMHPSLKLHHDLDLHHHSSSTLPLSLPSPVLSSSPPLLQSQMDYLINQSSQNHILCVCVLPMQCLHSSRKAV